MAADHLRRIGPDHAGFCDAIDRHLPRDRAIVSDATMAGNSWGAFRLPVREPRGYMYSTSLSIGVALPLAIGVAIGGGRRTVAIHGDGGVMLNIGELATVAQEQLPIILLVFNDAGYGVLRALQDRQGVPHVAVDLHAPDFTMLGKAMGLAAESVNSVAEFERAFADAVTRRGPSLIEIDLSNIPAPQL